MQVGLEDCQTQGEADDTAGNRRSWEKKGQGAAQTRLECEETSSKALEMAGAGGPRLLL